ncbi:LHFPL tetraspan subfamily member 2 protein-like [Littorina saxatilis]|uniref:Lipoma HMGIC fusion partner-like 2 protein n=1 Tax=Littorina saxatilis TaxID=31220 RepID=A0AAN9G5P7_9CAEN
MCYVIITCRSMLWTLLSITSFMMLLAAVTSPHWLIGYSRHSGLSATRVRNSTVADDSEDAYNPTLGLFNRCLKLMQFRIVPKRENCAAFVTDFLMPDEEFPNAWKASLVFFSLAGVLLLFTSIAAVLSLCVRTACGKSVFTLSGLMQSVAGLMCILGLVVFPAGWGSAKVRGYCGDRAGAFDMDNCQLGWSFFLCVVGTLLTFMCSLLSVKADSATSSHKVEEEVLEGKNLICVL